MCAQSLRFAIAMSGRHGQNKVTWADMDPDELAEAVPGEAQPADAAPTPTPEAVAPPAASEAEPDVPPTLLQSPSSLQGSPLALYETSDSSASPEAQPANFLDAHAARREAQPANSLDARAAREAQLPNFPDAHAAPKPSVAQPAGHAVPTTGLRGAKGKGGCVGQYSCWQSDLPEDCQHGALNADMKNTFSVLHPGYTISTRGQRRGRTDGQWAACITGPTDGLPAKWEQFMALLRFSALRREAQPAQERQSSRWQGQAGDPLPPPNVADVRRDAGQRAQTFSNLPADGAQPVHGEAGRVDRRRGRGGRSRSPARRRSPSWRGRGASREAQPAVLSPRQSIAAHVAQPAALAAAAVVMPTGPAVVVLAQTLLDRDQLQRQAALLGHALSGTAPPADQPAHRGEAQPAIGEAQPVEDRLWPQGWVLQDYSIGHALPHNMSFPMQRRPPTAV